MAQFNREGVTHEVQSHNHTVEEQGNGQLEDRLEEALFLDPVSAIHSIILDWTSVSFVDSVGAKAIKQVLMLLSVILSGLPGGCTLMFGILN